jgi:effector-binding domain-containing protein
MSYAPRISVVDRRPLASVSGRADAQTLGPTIIELLTEVWGFIKESGVSHTAINVVVYPCEPGGGSSPGDASFAIEAGVEVAGEVEGRGRVKATATPEGRAVTVAHLGPYDQMGGAHLAIRDWCLANGEEPAGTSWEVYGHWSDDPAHLRTDVFYLLR